MQALVFRFRLKSSFLAPAACAFQFFAVFFPLVCFSFFLLFEGKYMGSFEIVTGLI